MKNRRAFILCLFFTMALFLAAGVLPAAAATNRKAGNRNKDCIIYGEFFGISAGTFTMPGRNISIGLRWQK